MNCGDEYNTLDVDKHGTKYYDSREGIHGIIVV